MDALTEKETESADLIQENIAQLRALFPEAFTEDGIDFDTLRRLLGAAVAEGEEKFGLAWHGKRQAQQIALAPSAGTLLPCPADSVAWNTTQNIFIEGDNLEVLKLLQRSYANQAKMIYIDPPYNTGKEFIYPDKFKDNLDTYLQYTGQVDDDGMHFSTNTETSGRKHTNWLNMMYPRLKLARSLLRSDGVIFISIDDNEQANLKKICDEIFGEENFIAVMTWKKRTGSNDAQNNASIDHDYVVCYGKGEIMLNGVEKDFSNYDNPDDDLRGPWTKSDLTCNKTASERPNLYYSITDPATGKEYQCGPNRVWVYEKKRMDNVIAEGKVLFPKTGAGTPTYKRHLSEVRSKHKPFSSMIDTEMNFLATKKLRKLIGGQYFDYPKGVDLLKQLISQGANSNDIILDFFAGSATTAHAVMQLNAEDNGKRRFICVQLPEPCAPKSEAYKAGYKTIADIGKERIRRAAAKIKKEHPDHGGDLGFKVFKLSTSSIRPWRPDPADLEQTLRDHVERLVDGRSEHAILYELLLKRGIDLAAPLEEKAIAGKTVYAIGGGVLFACLHPSIDKGEIEALGQGITDWRGQLAPEVDTHVFFRDSAFADDIAKTNMVAILEQNGIAHVRSL